MIVCVCVCVCVQSNYRSCSSPTSSKAVKGVDLSSPLIASVWREKEDSLHNRLDLNGNIHISSPDSVDSWRETDTVCHHVRGETAPADSDLKLETQQPSDRQGRRLKCVSFLLV